MKIHPAVLQLSHKDRRTQQAHKRIAKAPENGPIRSVVLPAVKTSEDVTPCSLVESYEILRWTSCFHYNAQT
jgi:hypothetical protein